MEIGRSGSVSVKVVVGRQFVWLHLGKTGGDATYHMFRQVPELIVRADGPKSPAKHDTPDIRQSELLSSLDRIMNIRRLPSWLLSHAHHFQTHYGIPIPASEMRAGRIVGVSGGRRADRLFIRGPFRIQPLRKWVYQKTTHPAPAKLADEELIRYEPANIRHWLRTEYLAEDFVRVFSQYGGLKAEAVAAIHAARPINSNSSYSQTVSDWFSDSDLERIYEANPIWSSVEREVYGATLVDVSERKL